MSINTKKLLTATITNYRPAFYVLDHANHQSHQLLVDLKHAHYLPVVLLYVDEFDVEWLVRSHEQLLYLA